MKKRKTWLHFIVNLSIAIIILCITGIASLFFITGSYVEEEIKSKARSYFNSILITSKWNAQYGGVYVFKKNHIQPTSYIKESNIKSVDGKIYTAKNSSVMTIEISRLAENEGPFSYKMRSLKPLNPSNTPDEFETISLAAFEHGEAESFQKTDSGEKIKFRYMAPLYVTDECMKCHGIQGYKPGEIRGGISITFDITSIEKNLSFTKTAIIILGLLSLLISGGIFFLSVRKLKRKIDDSRKEIEELTSTDDLTSIYNRHYFFKKLDEEFERTRRYGQTLSLLIADIDHFKTFNARYGQQAGDKVIREVAQILKNSCRSNDTTARYGGKKFAIILPSTTREGAAAMAEKLQKIVSEYRTDNSDFTFTISIGISILTPECAYSPTTLFYDADSALYRAKEGERNRYVIA